MERVLGINLSIEVSGKGEAALILLHGGGGAKIDWAEQVRRFSPSYRIVAVDLPGHGESPPSAHATVRFLGACAAEVKRRYGLERNVLVAHSMGCRVALELHQQYPTRDLGIILIEGSRLASNETEASELRSTVLTHGAKTLLKQKCPEMFHPSSDPKLVEDYLNRFDKLDETFIQCLLLSVIEWDLSNSLNALKARVPLLLLHSTDERSRRKTLLRADDSPWVKFVHDHHPDVETEIIPDADHFPHLTRPDIVNRAIEHFLRRVKL